MALSAPLDPLLSSSDFTKHTFFENRRMILHSVDSTKCLQDEVLQLLKSSALKVKSQSDHVLVLSGRKHSSENSRLKLD